MPTFDDQDIELDFFEEPETVESPRRSARRGVRRRGGPRAPGGPPPAGVAVARLAGFVVLAIVLVVGIAAAVGGGKSGHDEYASYMKSVTPLAQSSERVGAAFASELGSSHLTLAGFQSKLQQWSRQEQQAYERAQQLRPPGRLQAAHQQLLGTFQLRALGLAGLANVLARSKGKDAGTVAAQLAAEAQLLSSSDIVWSELYRQPAMQALKTLGVTGVTVPASQFVTNPDVISSRSFALVDQRLQPASSSTGGKVSGLHGSALVSTVASVGGKNTTLSTSTPATIPLSQGLSFKVTFENAGNFAEVNVPVTLSITVGGTKVYSQKQLVASIESKQQTTVTFSNIQVSSASSTVSHSAAVTVLVGKVPGETNLTNNSATYEVFFTLPAGQ